MQLTFEKQLIKTGAIWGDRYKSKYTVMDATNKVIAELEYLNLSASFWYKENNFVIEPKNKVFVTKYLLFVENQENPILSLIAELGPDMFARNLDRTIDALVENQEHNKSEHFQDDYYVMRRLKEALNKWKKSSK